MAKAKATASKVEKPKVEKPKAFKVKNNTPYFKVDPEAKTRYNAYETCRVLEITSWLKVQIEAKLFTVIE